MKKDPVQQAKAFLESEIARHDEWVERGEFDGDERFNKAWSIARHFIPSMLSVSEAKAGAVRGFQEKMRQFSDKAKEDLKRPLIHCPKRYTAYRGKFEPHPRLKPQDRIFYEPDWYLNTDDILDVPIENDGILVYVHSRTEELVS